MSKIACLPTIDANGDGAVSREEIEKRLAAYIAAAPHIEPFVCFVWHRGKPLTGATVRLVPEPFLADDLPAATGTVGDDGFCVVAIDAEKMPIVHAGMYRVEVRSPHVNLPDKFNDRTELGVEVAAKSITLRRGGTHQFDLGS